MACRRSLILFVGKFLKGDIAAPPCLTLHRHPWAELDRGGDILALFINLVENQTRRIM